MKILLNILLPVGLALAAGILNYAVLAKTAVTHSYIKVTQDLKLGETFDLAMFEEVEVTAIVSGAVPWEDRNVLATLRTPRPMQTADWIMYSDVVPQEEHGIQLEKDEVALNVSLEGVVIEPKLLKIGQPIGFVIRKSDPQTDLEKETGKARGKGEYQIVGPFRLVTLGDAFMHEVETEEHGEASPPKTISVAVPGTDGKTLNPDSQLLAQAVEQTLITAIVLYPTKRAAEVSTTETAVKQSP
jgi:hypothetical protein